MVGIPLRSGKVVTPCGSCVAPRLGASDLSTSPGGFGVVVSPRCFAEPATLGGFGIVTTSEGICVVCITDIFGVVNSPGQSRIANRPEFGVVWDCSGDMFSIVEVLDVAVTFELVSCPE